jgi:hypothetical protein
VLRASAICVAAALLLAACDTTAPTTTPDSTRAATASGGPSTPPSSSTPSSSPAASSSPVDVSAPFLARITTANTGRLTFAGSVARGSEVADASGSLTFAGADTEQVTTISQGGGSSTIHSIHVLGLGYTKSGDGPWLKNRVPPKQGADLWTLARSLRSVVDAGLETGAGRTTHRIELPSGTAVPAGAFGLDALGLGDSTVTLVFHAAQDGTPLGITLNASGTETIGSGQREVRATLALEYTQLGGAVAVEAPDHVWKWFNSARFHFSVAYPDGWAVDTSQPIFDYLNGPSVTHVGGRRLAAHGRSLEAWSKTIIDVHNGARLEYTLLSWENRSLAGTDGVLLTSKYRDYGRWLICYEVVAVTGRYVYDIFWVSPLKTMTVDRVTYEQMLTTFAFG